MTLLPKLPLAALLLAGCSAAVELPARPDVVLFVVDTLRNDRLGCYGYERDTSPVLDALATEGALFTDVTAQAPWTLPSMVSLFQGRYLTNYRDSLQPDVTSLPEAFQRAGYRTIGVVANCLVDADQGFARGFDSFQIADCWEDEEQTIRSRRDIQLMREYLQAPAREALQPATDGRRAPVFLYVHAFDPHDPYLPHDELNAELPLGGAFEVEPSGYWRELYAAAGNPDPRQARNRNVQFANMREMRARYDQEIRFFDAGLADILADLASFGLGADAVHALVADHGEGLWEHVSNESPEKLRTLPPHQFFYKAHGGDGYQPASATPFVLWGGAVPRGLRVDAAVENVDLYPTLLELADIAPPNGLHGRSLVPLFAQGSPSQEWRTHVFSYGVHSIAVRDVRTGSKLILPSGRSLSNGRGIELYDLNADPGERVNLADERPEDVVELVAVFETWAATDPTPSSMKGLYEEWNLETRRDLGEKLRALGYTESDTGLGADGVIGESGASPDELNPERP